jgi:hypothetical protein
MLFLKRSKNDTKLAGSYGMLMILSRSIHCIILTIEMAVAGLATMIVAVVAEIAVEVACAPAEITCGLPWKKS